MTKELLNKALSNASLPVVEEIIGKQFAFTYKVNYWDDDDSSMDCILTGTIIGVHWSNDDNSNNLDLHVSSPTVWPGTIKFIYFYERESRWVAYLDEENLTPVYRDERRNFPWVELAGEFQLL